MVDFISTLGLQLVNSTNITSGQNLLSKLSQQLTTGKYSQNLTDYTSSNAQKLMNFNSQITQQKGFLDVITTLTPRMEMYEKAFEGVEKTASEAFSTILSVATYTPERNGSLRTQIEGFMDQVQYYLDLQVGERYIFSGSRYDTPPVTDIKALPVPPTEVAPYLAVEPAVPAYDADYDVLNPADPHPEAWVNESTSIDVTRKLTYGITSNETGFQQVVMGLRWAYAATQDQANYSTYMDRARDLLTTGIANVRATHTDNTNAYSVLNRTKDLITSNISNLTNQIDDTQNVDVNEVAVKITTLQAQLEASYAATAKMINLTILNYL